MRCQIQTLVRTLTGGSHPSSKAVVRTMSTKSTGLMFQLKVDPLTGNSEWVVIEEEVDEISPKPMLATTSYLDMLNDAPRNRAYRNAIDRTVSKHCHVLDIGSGTGLLSMMAARAMGIEDLPMSEGMVTACESYLPMVKLMKKVLRANNMDPKIRVFNKRSDELQVGVDIASRAHVLVSEILDSELLGEGLIPSLQHAHDNLLVENYQTVPYRATTYGQLVESTYLWKLHDLYNIEANMVEGNGIHLVPKGKENILGVKPQQFAMHCDAMAQDIRLLSEPFKIFEFDFWKRPDSHGERELCIKATDDGTVHAVISWWVLELDDEGDIFYSTAPKWIGPRNWCDHWKQCVWFSEGKGFPVCKDTDVCMDATHTETSISYGFKAQTLESDEFKTPIITLSPERIAIYGDSYWRHSMLKAISHALEGKECGLCVVGDDSVFLTVAVAHLSKTAHVMSLFPGLREKGSQYLEAVADENGYSMDRVEVISTRKQQWTMNDTHQKKVRSGTGLLSMMAARAMGIEDLPMSEGMVTACESYLPMVKLMKKVLRANNMDPKIRVFNKRSDELQVGVDIASRAHVLVSEILDSELLGEGLIPSLQHAHDNLLVENYQTVPYRATTYGQLVESTYLWKLHDLYNIEANMVEGNGIHLVPKGKENILGVKPQQFAMHCDAMAQDIRLLSEPFKIFEFDFWKRPDSHGERELCIKATDDGTVHAVISWWVLELDDEGDIFYSTAPKWIGPRNWCDHWKQCVWFSEGKGFPVCKDTDVCMDATHTETSISYGFKAQTLESDEFKTPIITLSPERIAIYGDSYWRHSMLKAISHALEGKECGLCVVGDDSVFLTVAVAHLSKTAHVMSLFPGLREKGSQYLEAVADENGYSMDRVEVISTRKQQWTMNDTHQKKVDLLIAEPFYFGAEGMLPWQNLQFWSKRTMLDSVLSEDVCIMPCKGILKACAMSFPDLWRSRRSLENIEGFDHSMVNSTLGASSSESPCFPFFIWQCGQVQKLSDTYTMMEFDFLKPLTSCHAKLQVEFPEAGVCHGFALWIDWVLDSTNNILISTGPDQRYWKQGVKLLAEPLKVGVGGVCSTVIEATFDSSSGELSVSNT